MLRFGFLFKSHIINYNYLLNKNKYYNITTTFRSIISFSFLTSNIKDKIKNEACGVYKLTCECKKVYIGETRRSVKVRRSEHERAARLTHPNQSAVAEHTLKTGHRIDLDEVQTLHMEDNNEMWNLIL